MVSWKMGWAASLIWTMGLGLGLFAVSVPVGAAVHKVGDSAGWTTLIPVDYAKWASSKNFHVGDSLLFSYNNTFHNVLQVDQQQYKSCNSSSPAASYNSGADSIPLKRTGTFYFLCGFPGHCQEGQKVEIKVTRASSSAVLGPSPGPSPSPSPSSSSSPHPSGPAPTPSAASTLHRNPIHHVSLLMLAAFVVAFYHVCV